MNKLCHFPFVMFCTALYSGFSFVSAVVSLILYPFMLVSLAWGLLTEFSWKKIKAAAKEIFNSIKVVPSSLFNLMKVIPLSFYVWYWSVESFFMYFCYLKTIDEINPIVEKKIYKNLDTILTTLTILPLSDDPSFALTSVLDKLKNVIFGEGRLPYPDFLTRKGPAIQKVTPQSEVSTSFQEQGRTKIEPASNGEIKSSNFDDKSQVDY